MVNFYPVRGMPINQESIVVEDGNKKRYELFADCEKGMRGIRTQDGLVIFKVFIEERAKGKKIVVEYGNKRYRLENEVEPEWTLNAYNRQFYLDLKERLIDSKENSYISYKFVYLNNYHGMKQQEFCFDRRFGYMAGEITYDERAKLNLPLAYSSKITSIHAIVGKNGTGKTSIVNFLGNEFVNIMFELEKKGATVSDILAGMEPIKNAEFLVVFEMDGKYYFVSNINDIKIPEQIQINQYEPSRAGSVKRALSKVFYFSNKVDNNELFELIRKEKDIKDKEGKKQKMEVWGTKDYSEQSSLCKRISWYMDEISSQNIVNDQKEVEKNVFNTDLFYQLLFLRNHFEDGEVGLKKLLWKKFCIDNLTLGEDDKDKSMKSFIHGTEGNKDWQNLFSEKRSLQYFSSGQYARFSFLSKLYWIVKGYSENAEIIERLGEQKKFYEDDVIEEDDFAILFIDEGDLYYHPEWQRKYICDLCRIIEEKSVNYKIQIIIATNSPFILSDVYEGNIIFLHDEEDSQKSRNVKQTFGQNIHTLLNKDFFMDYTIGEFARDKIVHLFKVLETQQYRNKMELADKVSEILKVDVVPDKVYEQLYHFADNIGEDVYRRHLLDLIEKHMKALPSREAETRIHYLKMRQKEIEEEIQELEKEEMHDYDKNE